MKAFLYRSIYFFGVLSSLFIVGLLIPPKAITESLHYSIFDKHQLLEQQGEEPRIILIGGSNLSFGIYSPLIEKAFGVKVINTAIHFGYGLKYIIDDVKPFIRKNDIVIIAPEYDHFFGDIFYGDQALIQGLNVYPSNLKLLNINQLLTVLDYLPKHSLVKIRLYLTSLIRPMDEIGAYHRKSFNANGDVIEHWNLPSEVYDFSPIKGKFNQKAMNYLSQFVKEIEDKGGSCYITFPGLSQSSFQNNQDAINLFYDNLLKENLPLLGTPAEYSIADSLHFDTHYHLIKKGQIIRTEKLIKDLEKHGL